MASSIETKYKIDDDAIIFANFITSSVIFPYAASSAIELGIFDILAKTKKQLSAKDIAIEIGSKNPKAPRMLDSLLRLLASHSMLYCSLSHEDQQHGSPPSILYSLAPSAQYFVLGSNDESLEPGMKLALGKVSMESWDGFKGAVLEGGISFNRVHGMSAFEYASVNPMFNNVFNKAMFNFSNIIMKRVIESYKGFEHINTLVDVGGGLGINLQLITSKHSHIQGVNFDLPHVIENAQPFAGVTHVGGDMFESIPKGDAIFLKSVLHNWNDEDCVKILKNCYKAIPNYDKVIIVESILPVLPENTIISKVDSRLNLVMNLFTGGIERTHNKFKDLASRSGFSDIKFVNYISGQWIIELLK